MKYYILLLLMPYFVFSMTISQKGIEEIIEKDRFERGKLFAQKGFLQEFLAKNEISPETKAALEVCELEYYKKRCQKQWEDYSFSTEAIEIVNYLRLNFDTIYPTSKGHPFHEKIEHLRELIKYTKVAKKNLDGTVAQMLWEKGLVESFFYYISPGERLIYAKELLRQAAFWGHVPTLRFLIERGWNVNTRLGPEKQTMLHFACWRHRWEVVEFLINKKALLNTVIQFDRPPLFFAECTTSTPQQKEKLINFLIEHGADPNYKFNAKNNSYALSEALRVNDTEHACKLLTTDIPLRYGRKYSLKLCIDYNNKKLLKLLLNQSRICIAEDEIEDALQEGSELQEDCRDLLKDYLYLQKLRRERKEKKDRT